MIYYFLPDPQVYGGVKVGYQFAQLLNDLNVPVVVTSPQGKAPLWFSSSISVISEEEAFNQLGSQDWVLFSLPTDYERLKSVTKKLIFHCQGTNPLIDKILQDSETLILTCWDQAKRYVNDNFGREPVEVGIAISDCFFRSRTLTLEGFLSYMPRRGNNTVMACMDKVPDLTYQPIEGLNESEVAVFLQQSEYFLATAEGEWFGLPALEAMAAACIVISVPVLGGMEYLQDQCNCLIAKPEEMPEMLSWIKAPEQAFLREKIRYRAVQTATKYRLSLQRKRLSKLLSTQLKGLV